MTYEEARAYLEDACTFGIKPGLMRIHELLVRLGNPHETYKTVHVTGTNGKGSVTAVIANVLTAAGRKTGRYTSPHLEEYTERMSIDGRLITKEEFAIVTEKVKEATEGMKADGFEQPTEFEMLTAPLFYIFIGNRLSMQLSKSVSEDCWTRLMLLRRRFPLLPM